MKAVISFTSYFDIKGRSVSNGVLYYLFPRNMPTRRMCEASSALCRQLDELPSTCNRSWTNFVDVPTYATEGRTRADQSLVDDHQQLLELSKRYHGQCTCLHIIRLSLLPVRSVRHGSSALVTYWHASLTQRSDQFLLESLA